MRGLLSQGVLQWQGTGLPEISLIDPVLWRLAAAVEFVRGRRPSSKQADDPCRAIEIVAPKTGQLCATAQVTPDLDCTRYSRSAGRGATNTSAPPALARRSWLILL
jgi:hypothetical protein